eukprot:Opistho-2@47869
MKGVFDVSSKKLGEGPVTFAWQRSQGNYLAACGVNRMVFIFDRHGDLISEIALQGPCMGMDWDKDGDVLAVIQDKSAAVYLWDAYTKRSTMLDSGMKDLTFCRWSATEPLLAIGTAKGNLLIYNRSTSKKVPILGKHTKRIDCGAWNSRGNLVLGSEDKSFTISNGDGDTLAQPQVRAEPELIQFAERGQSGERSNIVSMSLGKKSLYLYNPDEPDSPIELQFQARYGNIVSYRWYGDGYVMIGFSNGFLVVISTSIDEIGQELYQSRNHKDYLSDIAISTAINKAASIGDNCVKIHDLSDMKDIYNIIQLDDDRGNLDKIAWSDDGQLLCVSTKTGKLYTFLTKMPVLGSAFGTKVAHLTSLLEVTVEDAIEKERPVTVSLDVEPAFVALGSCYVAVGMNNRAWFYASVDRGYEPVGEREYVGSITKMALNSDYAAVLHEGRVLLHMIEGTGDANDEVATDGDRSSQMFPDADSEAKVQSVALTNEFLIYGSDAGSITYFMLEDWHQVTEFRHVVGIKDVFPDVGGSRLIFFDEKNDGFLFTPVNDALIEIPHFSAKARGALWDNHTRSRNCFVVYDDEKIQTYIACLSLRGAPEIRHVGSTKLPFGHAPLMMHNGAVTCLTQSGRTASVTLTTHELVRNSQHVNTNQLAECLQQHVDLHRFSDAWPVARLVDEAEAWQKLGKAALEQLDIPFAIRVYRQLKDVGMVLALQRLDGLEDRSLLCGHVALMSSHFDTAQALFLQSSYPAAALEMRKDLLQWDQALQLAKTLSPVNVPYISKEYAQQLELKCEYGRALQMFEAGITNSDAEIDHDVACQCGIARMAIRTNDFRRGIRLATELDNRQLYRDCGSALEAMKQFSEAGTMFEKGRFFDRAVQVYLITKNYAKAGELLENVSTPKLHVQYAKAREAEGKYKEAVRAYQNAKDYDSVIRIYLDNLKNPEEAVRIVRETQSSDGARMVAKFFQNMGEFRPAVEFLVVSKQIDEAFKIAQANDVMEVFAEVIGSDGSTEDYQSIALYFEGKNNHLLAGKFFMKCGQHTKALRHFLAAPIGDGESIDYAIETVGLAKNERLVHTLIDFLMGDTDGQIKDPKYIFKLWMSLKQYREAARTAIIIAREEQNNGHYREAHDTLFKMYKELEQQKIRIPAEMVSNLMILHSYILVKMHIKQEDHLTGARMLIRVANNISKFPTHIVPILTTTVIECQRSNLKNSAFSYAAMLMRPEYRTKIDAKYKRKIEMIVRKPERNEEEEPKTACPYCKNMVPQSELNCPDCKNTLPYCIATGFHMEAEDWSVCPMCQFPALYSKFSKLIELERKCPMCTAEITPTSITHILDPRQYLAQYSEMEKEPKENKAAASNAVGDGIITLEDEKENSTNV